MPDHYVNGSTSNGQRQLKKGGMFIARFQVTSPAMQPPTNGVSQPDPMTLYIGKGHFITTSNPLASPEGLDAD